jgi:purine catabolism regulator
MVGAMGDLADGPAGGGRDLPTGGRTRSASALARGLTVAEALNLPSLRGADVLAGAGGLDRVIRRLNVMELPDVLPWVEPHELLLTTGSPLRGGAHGPARLVRDLDGRGLAAVAVRAGGRAGAPSGAALAAADEVGLPVLRLGAGVALGDVLNRLLTDILNRQAATLARAEEAHRVLVDVILAGGGLAAITGELARLLDGGVLVAAPDGRVLARSGVAPELLRDPRYFAAADGRFLAADPPHGPRTPDDGTRVVQVPILAGTLDHGRVVLITRGRAADSADVHLLERAAATAALVITKDLAVAAVEGKYQGDFLRDLLAGRAGDAAQVARHCAALGWDVDRPLVVVVAEMDPEPGGAAPAPGGLCPGHEHLAEAWSLAVRERDPRAAVAGYSREVVVVMGAGEPADGAEDGAAPGGGAARRPGGLVRTLAAQVAGWGGRSFATGVSRVAARPEDIPMAYEQARRAARVGRQMHGAGAVAEFDELGVYRLLSQIPDTAELRSFMAEALGPLAARGDPETDDLRTTLEALLDNNLNVAETARLLHFHYNTLRYRIGKLERLLGPFTTDPHLRLDLLVALRAFRMRSLAE